MRKTMAARENYRPLPKLASKLFFILNDFASLDRMYQFSLESYISLFANNISKHLEKNPAMSDSLQDKLESIMVLHKREVYRYACRGLFEKDKILLSLQMAVRLSDDVDKDEYNFFLRGRLSLDKKNPPYQKNDWISEKSWENICELERMGNFNGIIGAFIHNAKEWKRWYMSASPESEALPGEWEQKCDR